MEHKPHIPGYGEEGKMERHADREMTMEELNATEVDPVTVVRKGFVESKVCELKKPDVAGMEHRIRTEEMSLHLLQEKLVRETIGGRDVQARVTEAQIEHKKREIEKIKSGLMHNGKGSRA